MVSISIAEAGVGATGRFLGNLRIWPGPVLAVEVITATSDSGISCCARPMPPPCSLRRNHLPGNLPIEFRRHELQREPEAFFAAFGVMQLAKDLLHRPGPGGRGHRPGTRAPNRWILYAAPLSNLEIIIGKLGGQVLKIVFFVLSGVPVLALAMLMGGIAPQAVSLASDHHSEHGLFRGDGFHRRIRLGSQGPRRGRACLSRVLLPLGAAHADFVPLGPARFRRGLVSTRHGATQRHQSGRDVHGGSLHRSGLPGECSSP